MSEIKNAQDRTTAKLRYARLHLDELRTYPGKGSGNDFERSHQESFLFHLFGVRDAFLQELNLYYKCELEIKDINERKLRKTLNSKGINSPELEEITSLESEEGSWLFIAKEMRDHSTHRHSVSCVFYVGGAHAGEVHFKCPKSGRTIKQDYVSLFELWGNEMEKLVERLRENALSVYQSSNGLQPTQ